MTYEDGASITLQRRERPVLLGGSGQSHLFTTAKIGGADKLTGGRTWNMVQPLAEE